MNNALILTESDDILIGERFQTISSKNPLKTFSSISKERAKSFFIEPSVESDVDQANCQQINNSFSIAQETRKKKPIALVPKTTYPYRAFSALQKWEGYVIEINDKYFTARVTDLSEKHEDEEIEVMFTEISDDDKKLVCVGAIFYWNIGYEKEKGTVKRSSMIRFRRLPRWTKTDVENAKKFQDMMESFLNV